MKNVNDEPTAKELENEKMALEGRIKKLEIDLKAPLEATFNEQAPQISNLIILRRILEVERSNLVRLNFEIEKRKQQSCTGEV